MVKSQQHYQQKINSNPVYNEKYIKPKIKSYNGKININFHSNKIPKEGSQSVYLSVIGSVYKKEKKYYPEVFLEECKYVC